ncbi:multidrug ABC transporter ATP-binding protein [Anaerocolumna cellulosilytica]|uniref:Multidrug ABC transporter ATP-binding protein n=1 Tax=Anaerocolumna cellulosilytica TaxID=433286 RepID=A0A6S6R5K9_9FIRM|nr:ABC transporter ATP-binding protein [Anaerocolumna cellulosilytica]MBB5194066.1 subfamily B ATP-binding cassette protein MsbA [Anaerocolumna cellulosilytica]BCJ94720.1 multidrug ABC transporter ATP-binding protein [Anaerocolumna cellulosilytica]
MTEGATCSKSKRHGTKSSFKRFLRYVRPHIWLIVIAAAGGIIKFTVPLIFPRIMQHFIDDVFSSNSVLSASEKIYQLNYWTLIIVGIYTFLWIPGTYVRHYFTSKAGNQVTFALRYDLYKHMQRMSASYYSKHQSGGIVSVLMNDIALVSNLVGNALTNIWMDGVLVIALLFILLRMDWVLTLASLSIFPFYLVVSKKIGRKVKRNSHMVQDETEEMSAHVQEKVGGYSVVQAFTHEEFERKRFRNEAAKLLNFQLQSGMLSSLNTTVTGYLTALAPIIVVWVGCQRINSGVLTIGELITFYAYLGSFYLPINRFAELNVVYSTSMAALERVLHVMDETPDIQDTPNAVECTNVRGEILLKNISFSYEENEKIIKNMNLSIHAGERIALVGASGSGKSTLVSLIPRFYDIDCGSVCLDGRDIREYKVHSLRQQVGIVPQETILFSGSIRENILYGNPEASEEDIIAAAKAANAYDFIEGMPDGFDTVLGERGAKLSGGQKQRIAIARVFIKNPKILILDEATSALDSQSERLIQEALDRLMVGRTTILIAHRLSTVVNADEIVVMNKGKIIEKGSHIQLLAQNGAYARLYHTQFDEAIGE